MERFELHVCANGKWLRFETFENRQDAMSASISLETSRRFPGVKIFKTAYDQGAMTAVKKLIHRWSEETELKEIDARFEENLERQRHERRRIRIQRDNKLAQRRKTIRNYCFLAGALFSAVAAAAALAALRGF